MLARVIELETDADWLAARSRAGNGDVAFTAKVAEHLGLAREALDGHLGRRLGGVAIDQALGNYHAAVCLLVRHTPLDDLRGQLPELATQVSKSLPPSDLRRVKVEDLLRRSRETDFRLSDGDRIGIAKTLRAAYLEEEGEQARIRSFRNIVLSVTIFLTVLAIALAVSAALRPSAIPLCFYPEEASKVVCPTGEDRYTGEGDLDQAFGALASPLDYALLESVGLVAAAIAAAASLRQMRGTSTPYGVPVALAALKLPTGALTAVVGLLLMRGQFVPGLSALDTSAQIIAWAVVFGYAQQLFTKLVDQRGQAILEVVGSSDDEEAFRRSKLQHTGTGY